MPNPYILLGFVLALALASITAYRHGVTTTADHWKARESAVAAKHSLAVADAQAQARKEEQALAAVRHAKELELARAAEARALTRLHTTNATLRALREASHADSAFARCLPVALPDGLRVEPPTTGPGGPAG